MDIYASDEEKGEEIKQWWRDNGISVAVACIVGLSVLFGGRYWTAHQNTQSESASSHYQQLVSFLADDKKVEAENATQKLLSEFSSTPYAVFAALEMAKQSLNDSDVTATKTYLEWVISNAKLTGQVEIARLRLAQCLFTESDYASALTLIEQSESQAFESLFSELRGDIYASQNEKSQARAAYQAALLRVDQGEPRQQVLQLKLDDMAGA